MIQHKENMTKNCINLPIQNNEKFTKVEEGLFLAEVENYLYHYPNTKHIDICLHDINGHIRGKRIDITCLNKIAEGCYFPCLFMQ